MDVILSYIPAFLKDMDTWKIIFFSLNLVIVAYLILLVLDEKKRTERALGRKVKKKKMVSKNNNIFYFGRLKKNINSFFMKRERPGFITPVFYFASILPLIIGGLFMMKEKYFLGVISVFAFYYLMQKIFEAVQDDMNDKIEEALPLVIDTVIKTYSKYGDLKTVISETARTAPEPLHTHLNILSRRLVTEDPETCLNDFAEELDNTWIYSFIFILSSYKGTTKKADVLANLADLRNVIEEENRLKRQSATDKQYNVVVNYTLAFAAVAGFFINIKFNPIAEGFFYETLTGLGILIAGYACVFATIILNLGMKKKKGRRK